jgi:hypothetical protein
MGFFTRIPQVIRHLGQQWRDRSATTATPDMPPYPRTTRGTGSPEVGICVAPATIAPLKCMPKLRTICTADGALGQRSKAVRVVISGRMADVCAELDRLIALEAQPTLH